MKTTFGNKLFRLFLLFSIAPALILTIVGYYLTMESSRLQTESASRPEEGLSRYYNNLLYERIDASIEHYRRVGTAASPFLDFLFIMTPDTDGQVADIEAVLRPTVLSPGTADAIIVAAKERDRGFLGHDDRFFQYVKTELPGDRQIYAGLVHTHEYADMLQSMQDNQARESISRVLRPRYAVFLSVLFVLLAAVTLFLAYVFSARISRSLARPLTDLSHAAGQIATGDFDQHVKPAGDEEIRTLIDNFNHMASRLSQTTSRLAQTQRVAAWRQVARRFAHELKNPIQPILISLYRIEKQLIDTDAYDKIYEPLKAASDELKHLITLAERFSHLAKLPPPALEPTDLNELVTSVVNLYDQQLAAFEFEARLLDPPLVAEIDPAYLREALHNVLQNAIDASDPGCRIELSLETDADRIDISLQDFGEGMDNETAASARLPYFTTKEKGTGLGLAIVEKSVSEMGGEVYVQSKRGYGTTVTISIPHRESPDAGPDTDS